jgi:hypothetical protein
MRQIGVGGLILVRSHAIGILSCAIMLLAVPASSRAQFCNADDGKRVADEIARIFNDLSVDNAMICNATGSGGRCELVCTSPQKISDDDQRHDVLPLLTAVAGIAMRAIGRSDFSAITFMDNHLAAQGRSLQMPARRALQLYASLDDGTVNADAFRANVAREFTEKADGSENDAEQVAPAIASLPQVRPHADTGNDGVQEAPAISLLPRPRPVVETGNEAVQEAPVIALLPRPRPHFESRNDVMRPAPPISVIPRPRLKLENAMEDHWQAASTSDASAVELPALSDVPLPRRRPRLSRPRPKAPATPSAGPAVPSAESPIPLPGSHMLAPG